ncbi:MAG TPA: aminotransferase class V-fold PLP-dependent enzyme [Kofleriaceae bacterium]|nr:aminotransferase class V-fold PLP-dependent enzyme [Kofleriaceae bacterium]
MTLAAARAAASADDPTPTSSPTPAPTPAASPAPAPGGLRYPYGRQDITDADIAAVVAALRGDLLTCGPAVGAFEAALGQALGARHVTVCSNGTAALHLAYASLGLGAGDEVITSPITFSATASAAYQVGATVRFADVDPATGNLTPASVEALIGPRTRAITAVHLGGQPADLDDLARLARAYGLWLVEDACHALGATYRGAKVAGGQADAAVLSFHPVKHITSGEGGAVVFRDAVHQRHAQRLRHHGLERDPARFSRPSPGPWYHEVVEQGFNYRLPDLNCALGLSQLTRLAANVSRRRAIARRYRAAIEARWGARGPVQAPVELADRASAYHLFAAAIDFAGLGVDRGAVMTALAGRGIGSQVHYIPLHQQPFHRARAGSHADLPRPGTDHYYQRTLSLPMYPQLTDAAVDEIVDALAQVIAELPESKP